MAERMYAQTATGPGPAGHGLKDLAPLGGGGAYAGRRTVGVSEHSLR